MQRDSIDFSSSDVGKLFRRFLFPTVMGMVFSAVFVITDGIFVGRGIGSDALASVNIVAPLFTLGTGLGLMFGMGGSVVASINLAQDKRRVAEINITQSLALPALLIALLSALLIHCHEPLLMLLGTPGELMVPAREYLVWFTLFLAPLAVFNILMFIVRLDGAPGFAMACNIMAACINIALDYLFIFVFEWGLAGNSISGKDTSKMIVCVNQFEHIFHASFTQNATLFESYPLSRMRSALRYFDNEKLNSLLQKDNAQELSGGENQMMQLIRAITADKPIMLMDESFSAVDVNNTNQLREKLLSLDKTILFVTHDVSAEHLKLYDEIIVLQHGKIVEQGSFLQLMEKQQYFYHLYHTSEK